LTAGSMNVSSLPRNPTRLYNYDDALGIRAVDAVDDIQFLSSHPLRFIFSAPEALRNNTTICDAFSSNVECIAYANHKSRRYSDGQTEEQADRQTDRANASTFIFCY